jgi:hypothetical protein
MGRYLDLAKAVEAADFCEKAAFTHQFGGIVPNGAGDTQFEPDRECEKSELSEKRSGVDSCEKSEKRSEPASAAVRALTTTTHPAVFPGSGAATQDWRDWFEERAAIAEHDRDLPRTEAEALAFECCAVAWLNCHPPIQDDPDQCIHCGQRMAETEALPFLTGEGGHVWMHDCCHAPWMSRRQAEAAEALRNMGIVPPSG